MSEIIVRVDGERVIFPDQQPIVVNGRALVPIRAPMEALGHRVSWHREIQTIRITTGEYDGGFIWPVMHGAPLVTQGFNSGHGGVDIQNQNRGGFTRFTPLGITTDTPQDIPNRGAHFTGNMVIATRAGVVSRRTAIPVRGARPEPVGSGAGNTFIIAHGGGYFTQYLHLHHADFKTFAPGTPVSQGQKLGLTGQTGHVRSHGHLHFDVVFVENRGNFTAEQDAEVFRGIGFWGARTDTVRRDGVDYRWWKHNPAHYLPQLIDRTTIPSSGHHWNLRN